MNCYFCSLSKPILDRYCLQILPKIYDKILWLDLEPSSMERILLTTNYPNLLGFGLYNIREEAALYLFNGKIFHFDSSDHRNFEILRAINLFRSISYHINQRDHSKLKKIFSVAS